MGPFPYYYYVVIALQGVCLLHALKHRADTRWFYAIVFAPGIGAGIYFFLVVLPALRRGQVIQIELPMFESVRVGRLEKAFRFSDTIENRVALAEAYLNNSRKAEALELYKPVLGGVFKNDKYLLFGYARACYVNEAYADAVGVLEGSLAVASTAKLRERLLLLAMAHERLGHDEAAQDAYAKAVVGFHGEEARCRHALFLWSKQRRDEALAIFAKIIEHAAVSDRRYRRHERAWIAIAKQKRAEHAATPRAA